MSTTATRLPLAEARRQAIAFRDLFHGCHARWEIAGSIRRKRPEVGDIDHVVIANHVNMPALFGVGESFCAMRARVDTLLAEGVLTLARRANGRTCNGDKLIAVAFQGITHEICLCEDYNWGCFLAMKTGSASFSKALVTRMHDRGYRQRDGRLWRIERVPTPEGGLADRPQPLDCVDEFLFFGAAGLKVSDWPPERREGVPR